MTIETVLVDTDLTPHSLGALEHAVDLAQSLPVRVHIVYVKPVLALAVPPSSLPVDLPAMGLDQWARGELLRLQNLLLDCALECDVEFVEGNAATVIPQLAEALEADLIVMGTRAMGGLRRWLSRSVAERVCRLAPCPVTVVRASLASAEFQRRLERPPELDAPRSAGLRRP